MNFKINTTCLILILLDFINRSDKHEQSVKKELDVDQNLDNGKVRSRSRSESPPPAVKTM